MSVETLTDPKVLVTFIICAVLGALAVWLAVALTNRKREIALREQRKQQEATIARLLDSIAEDKEKIVAEYEERLREKEERIQALEKEVARLRDRITQGGFLGLFGGKQRDIISALLLENEQLHELLAQKQDELREWVSELTDKLVSRLEAQYQENARAIRYKQALLSAFLQQEETRKLLDRMLAEGRLAEPPQAKIATPSTSDDEIS